MLAGDAPTAAEELRASLRSFWELDDDWGIVEALGGIAALAGAVGRADRAAVLAGAAASARERAGQRAFPPDRALQDRYLDRARSALGAAEWRTMEHLGAAMPRDDAVDVALEFADVVAGTLRTAP
jgi:hypothetical protein